MVKKVNGLKGIFLQQNSGAGSGGVKLRAFYSASVPRSGHEIFEDSDPGFRGGVGDVLSFTRSYSGDKFCPATVAHFGLGRRNAFSHEQWRVALTSALLTVRHHEVPNLFVDASALWLNGFMTQNNDAALQFGLITAEAACAVLTDAPCIEDVYVWLSYVDERTEHMVKLGFEAGRSHLT